MEQEDLVTLYHAPSILRIVGAILSLFRRRYEQDVAVVVVASLSSSSHDDQQQQSSYWHGIVFVLSCFASILIVWSILLLYFKLRGRASYGCAAGYAVADADNNGEKRHEHQRRHSTQEEEEGSQDNESNNDDEDDKDDRCIQQQWDENPIVIHCPPAGALTTVEDSIVVPQHHHHQRPLGAENHNNNKKPPLAGSDTDDENHTTSIASGYGWSSSSSTSSSQLHPPRQRQRRETIIQICFAISCTVVLLCTMLIWIHVYHPLSRSMSMSDHFIADARYVTNTTSSAMSTISTATQESLLIAMTIQQSKNMSDLCPKSTSPKIKGVLGVDLESLQEFLNTDYRVLANDVANNLTQWSQAIDSVDDGIDMMELYMYETQQRLWYIPTLLLALCASSIAFLVGCYLARTRRSSWQFQQILSMALLPAFIALSALCWLATLLAISATSVSSDGCLSSASASTESSPSPYNTLLRALNASHIDPSDIVYTSVTSYATGCHHSDGTTDDPTQFIVSLQNDIQDVVDFVWVTLAKVDVVGRDNLYKYCGRGASRDEINTFLTGAQDLARLLTTIHDALGNATAALECQAVHRIYDTAVNDTICTDVASASAWSCILFFIIGIGAMVIVTLRASYRHTRADHDEYRCKDDDVVYDEQDVAENRTVNEHEEYLQYIDKYKHEWEEYQGMETTTTTRTICGQSPYPSQSAALDRGSTDSLDNSSSGKPFHGNEPTFGYQ